MPSFVDEARRIADRLRELDRRRVVFGASRHGHRFAAPLSLAAVEAFEAAAGTALPAAYRAYLTELGNGGPGPQYGMYPLEAPGEHALRPFVHEREFHVPTDGAHLPIDGAITIAEYGCGIFGLLVVRGPQAGSVWIDARYERGVFPAASFERWWLDGMGRELARFESVLAMMNAGAAHEEIHRVLEPKLSQLEVDDAMLSLMDVDPSGKPSVVAAKPWGMQCGLVDDHYAAWRAR